jgi:sugar lactone lactonase YvrE
MAKKGGDLAGTACKVTDGPNKGQTGTYTVDEDGNLWCEGSWGGTQCATKCSAQK